jgi:hypothetical protein
LPQPTSYFDLQSCTNELNLRVFIRDLSLKPIGGRGRLMMISFRDQNDEDQDDPYDEHEKVDLFKIQKDHQPDR